MAINLMSTILYTKHDSEAKEPDKSPIAAGFSMYSIRNSLLKANERMMIGTGISFILPSNIFGWLSSKTYLAQRGIDVSCSVIDSDHKGEVKVLLINNSGSDYQIKMGDEIAQVIFNNYFTGKLCASNQIDRKNFSIKDDSIIVVRKDFDTRFPDRFNGNKISFNFLTEEGFLIAPRSRKTVNTGLRFVFCPKVYGMVFGFPDLANEGVDCIEAILESDGNNEEIKITLYNRSTNPIYFAKRERIAQAIFIKNTLELRTILTVQDHNFASCSKNWQ